MSQQIKFLPFNAINEFMRPDFRLTIIRDVLTNSHTIPEDLAADLATLTKHVVKIPGFRNSEKAPPLVKVMPMVKAFEKSPELVSAILSAWAVIHNDLLVQVYDLLTKRGWPMVNQESDISLKGLTSDIIENWPVLPCEVNRRRAPGFWPRWPKGEDFEALYKTYVTLFPENKAGIDTVSLMAVWLALRLPYVIEEPEVELNQ